MQYTDNIQDNVQYIIIAIRKIETQTIENWEVGKYSECTFHPDYIEVAM